MPSTSWLATSAAAHPRRAAIETPKGLVTYAALHTRATEIGAELVVGRARRVGIALPPGRTFAEVLHACLLTGRSAVPVDPRLSENERADRLTTADMVVEAPWPVAAAVPAIGWFEPHASDVALVVHTSGTSAAPRPVELTYANLEASARASREALGLGDEERWLCAMPLSHVGGLSILTRAAIFGWTAVVHPGFDAQAVVRALQEDAITVVSLVPTMLARLLEAGLEHPPALRCALIGGGPMSPGLLDRARSAGVPVAQTYGLTEACSQVTTQAPGDDDGTAGRPLPGTELRIAADGEIVVSGPTVAPAAGPELHTGDLGALDENGRLRVTGRKAETIVTGGENVAPAEVEAALEEHAAVSEAAVHGRPDPEWGERVVATVVLRPGADADARALREHCAARLAGFKVPKEIAFAPELPRTASGKLLRRHLT